MSTETITQLLQKAIDSREPLFDAAHETAFRLFNGFTEGNPHLSLDLYAGSVIFHNYHPDPSTGMRLVHEAMEFIQHHPRLSEWLRAGIVKSRHSTSQDDRRGKLLFGTSSDRKLKEHGLWYAIDLTMNRDASFYLDTRHLRKWLIDHMKDKSVLNAFAYTGSFGVAALTGEARRVVQLDRSGQFLHLAKDSYALNGFSIRKNDFVTDDFFPAISRFKRSGTTFDCVLLDPPFFSSTSKGRVDQEADRARLINKVRPLIKDGGNLIAINNALYVSGREFMQTLESLCKDGYLKIEELIPVPEDFVGYNKIGTPITDPTPFNHSTKIVVLKDKKEDHKLTEGSMNNKQIVENFWLTMATNDFHAAAGLLHDDYILEWPQSGERIRGRDNFAAINTNYPAEGEWGFAIYQIVAEGDVVVSDVTATDGKMVGRVITFSTIRDAKIWKQVEFWPDPFEAPAWRAQWMEKMERAQEI